MKNNQKKVLRVNTILLVILFCLVLLLLTGCIQSEVPTIVDTTFIKTCSGSCWEDIIVDVTSREEAINLLKKSDYILNDSITNSSIFLRADLFNDYGEVFVSFTNDYVAGIGIVFYQPIPLGGIISEYGNPDGIILRPDAELVCDRYEIFFLEIVAGFKGIDCQSEHKANGKLTIDERTVINKMYFSQEEIFEEAIPKSRKEIHPYIDWQGYGGY